MARIFPGQYQDFYGIDQATNWLHSIDLLPTEAVDNKVPPRIQYFENMSEAMAKRCKGEVVIVTQTPLLMNLYDETGPYYPNIWANKEKPALIQRKKDNLITRFLLVDYDDPTSIWEYDLEDDGLVAEVPASALLSRDLHANETDEARLLVRDVCETSGLAQRLAKGDPFADKYDLFFD